GCLPEEGNVPDLRRLVGAGRNNPLAVPVIGDGEDRTRVREELHQLAVQTIDPGFIIAAANSESIGISTEADAADFGRGAEIARGLAVGPRPNFHRLVGAASRNARPVLAHAQRRYGGALLNLDDRVAVSDGPERHRLVGAAGHELIALGGEGDARHGTGMASAVLRFLALRHIEEAKRMVREAGGDEFTVRTQRHALHRRGKVGNLLELLAVRRIPNSQRLVRAAGRDRRAIRAIGDAGYRQGVARQRPLHLAVGEIPDATLFVRAAGEQSVPVGTQHRTSYLVRMGEGSGWTGRQLPELDRSILTGRKQLLAVRAQRH